MKELVINVCEDCYKIAILENKVLVDYQIEFKDSEFTIGDVFLGEIKKKPNNLEAFFVDLKKNKDGFLHIDDFGENTLTFVEFYKKFVKKENVKVSSFPHVQEEIYENREEDSESIFIEDKKDNSIRKNFDLLKIGSKTLVQVVKEPMFNKGARVSTRISLPGKYIVLIPFSNTVCVSRKITDKVIRERLLKNITEIKKKIGLTNFGIILRTSSLAFMDINNEQDFIEKVKTDLFQLLNKWSECLHNLEEATVGTKIISGDSRIVEILKDKLLDLFDVIYVDDEKVYEEIKNAFGEEYFKNGSIKLHKNKEQSLFSERGIDKQLKLLLNKKVSFGDEGYLIIEKTEAMVVIDVNSGGCNVNVENHEDMAFQTNLRAVEEISRQVRLRDIGGIIAIDNIDMRSQAHRDAIFEATKEAFANDTAEVNVLPLSKCNVTLMTRERIRPVIDSNIEEETCPLCCGKGKIDSSFNLVDFTERRIREFLKNTNLYKLRIFMHPLLHAYLTKGFFSKKMKMSWKYNKSLSFDIDYNFSLFDFVVYNNGKVVFKNNKTN